MPTADCGASSPTALEVQGPTLSVRIGFGEPTADNAYPALVDTGATQSCIDSALAVALTLPIIDRVAVSGVQGRDEHNVCLARVNVPSLGWTKTGRFIVVDISDGDQLHAAILGRDFLSGFCMMYEGRTGTVVLSNDVPAFGEPGATQEGTPE